MKLREALQALEAVDLAMKRNAERRGQSTGYADGWHDCLRRVKSELRAALAEPVGDEPPYGWHKPCEAPLWHSPVFIVGHEPPSPFTRERAVALGWIPVYTRPAAAPAERGELSSTTVDYPPLPETRYVLGKEGDGYSPDRLLSEAAYDADQMRAYVDSDRAQRVPLLQREIFDLWDDARFADGSSVENFARAIERAHGIGAKP